MSAFKKWIARLFNIRPEDLQKQEEKKSSSASAEEFDKKLQQEINRQVREQLQQMLQDVVTPELHNAIKLPVPLSSAVIKPPEDKAKKTQPVVIKPGNQPVQTLPDTSFTTELPRQLFSGQPIQRLIDLMTFA